MSSKKYESLRDLSLDKSNGFITSKLTASLIERKIMDLALSRIEVNANDLDYPLKARLYPGELAKLISDEKHIYDRLKEVAQVLPGHTIFIEDRRGNFKSFSLVPNCDYNRGVLEIRFNPALKEHVLFLKGDYTKLEQSILLGIESVASYRLYELFKKEAYRIPNKPDGYCVARYNISELRFMIGIANIENKKVKKALADSGKEIDWDYLYTLLDSKEKKYEDITDFTRYVIDAAQKELEESCDIRFEYTKERNNRKITHLEFTIFRNVPTKTDGIDNRIAFLNKLDEKNRQLEFPMDMHQDFYKEFVGHNELTKDDVTTLLETAGGDEAKTRKYINMADKQSNIKSYVGWIVRAIENNYKEIAVVDGDSELGSVLREANENIENNKEQYAEQWWAKIKSKDEFPEFIQSLEMHGQSLDALETVYGYQVCVDTFTDWVSKEGIFRE